jgi:hypothetical protein
VTLREAAQKALAAFETQLEAQGVTLPERRYVSPGVIPVWDDEQLVVNLQQSTQGQPGAPFEGTFVPGAENRSAQFAVSLVRVIPALAGDGSLGAMIPDEVDLGEAGLEAMDDAEALDRAAIAIHGENAITGTGMGFAVNGCATMGPEGGLASTRLLFTISL